MKKTQPLFASSLPTNLSKLPVSIAVCTALLGANVMLSSAQAADIMVTSRLDDDGAACTLREAISSANNAVDQANGCAVGSDVGADFIAFDPSVFSGDSTINLTQGQLALTDKNVSISAESLPQGITLVAGSFSRVVEINGGEVSLNNITITGGELLPDGDGANDLDEGGGLKIGSAATVTIVNSNVINNSAASRGGGIRIKDDSNVTLENTTVSNNFITNERGRLSGGATGGGISMSLSSLTLENSTVSNNVLRNVTTPDYVGGPATGGGIIASSGHLLINNSKIEDNTVNGVSTLRPSGGLDLARTTTVITNSVISGNRPRGLQVVDGTLELADSLVDNNVGEGVRLYSTADVKIIRSTISNNTGAFFAGGLRAERSSLMMTDSTISSNTLVAAVNLSAGGFYFSDSNVELKNSTISNNASASTNAPQDGGGAGLILGNSRGGYDTTVRFENVTIADNILENPLSAAFPGLVVIGDPSVTFVNSVLAGSRVIGQASAGSQCGEFAGGDLQPNITIDSATIIENGGCGAVRTDDPALLPLADNGGPTFTHALSDNSIAINSGDTASCLATDQRGLPRDATCDVGAFEFGATARALTLTLSPTTIAENNGVSNATVTRDEPFTQDLSVTLQSSDLATATVPSSVVIPAGQASANFAISAVDDFIADGDTVSTINASAVSFLASSTDITVTDDEVAALALTLPAATVSEDSGTISLSLSRNTPTDNALSVALSSNNTRLDVPATAVIPAGQSAVNIDLSVIDNQIAEGDADITLTATADGLQTGTAQLAVQDNEVPSLALSLAAASANEGSGTVSATLSRNTPLEQAVTVALSTDNTRLAAPANAVIPAGQTSVTVDLTLIDNVIADGDADITVSATADGLQTSTAQLAVQDNDIASLALTVSAETANEDSGTISATVSRNTPLNQAVTVALSSNSSRLEAPASVVIPTGQSSVSVDLNVIDNQITDGDVDITLSASANGLQTGTAQLTVQDNDVPSLTLTLPANTASEDSGTINVALSRNTLTDNAVTVALSSNNARLETPATVEIPAGQSSVNVDITLIDNEIADGDADITLTATAEGLQTGTAQLTLQDNEVPTLTLVLDQASILENESVNGTVSRNTPTTEALTINLTSNNAGRADVVSSVVIPAGESSATFSVAGVDNLTVDASQSVRITANSVDQALSASADVTVLDNDIDGDGMPNTFEQANGLDPRNASDANGDNDGDGFTNVEEFGFGTDPNVADTDENGNGVPDTAEASKVNIAPILLLLLDD